MLTWFLEHSKKVHGVLCNSTYILVLESKYVTSTHILLAYARLIAMYNIKMAGEFKLSWPREARRARCVSLIAFNILFNIDIN